MGALVAVGAPRVIVQFPYEPTTGADMEWNFVSPGRNTFFRILLQAKRLTGNGNIWTRYSYRELLHKTASATKHQVQVLCDTARTAAHPTYPLYAFYHPARVYSLAHRSGASAVAGVNLADGYAIKSLVLLALRNRKQRRYRSIGKVYRYFFPLSALLCSSAIRPILPYALSAADETMGPFVIRFSGGQRVVGIPLPPTPEIVRETLVRQHSASIDARETTETQRQELTPEVPPVGAIPDDIRRLLETRGSETPREENRAMWRVDLRLVKPSGFSINVGFPYRCLLDIMSV